MSVPSSNEARSADPRLAGLPTPLSPELQSALSQAIRTARAGDTQGGLKQARQAWQLAKEEGTPTAKLSALNTLAICQTVHGAFIEAIATAMDAFQIGQRLGARIETIHALTTLAGATAFVFETFDTALQALDFCLEFAETLNDQPLEIRIHAIRGVMLGNQKRFEEAEHEFATAMRFIAYADANTPPSLVAGNWASLYAKRARNAPATQRAVLIAAAEAKTAEALAIARQENNRDAEIRMFYNLGDLRYLHGDMCGARTLFLRVLELLGPRGQKTRIIDTHVEIGRTYAAEGQLAAALTSYQAAYREASTNRPSIQLEAVCNRMAEIYDQQGLHDEAEQQRTYAARERADFQREYENIRRQLERFWQPMAMVKNRG